MKTRIRQLRKEHCLTQAEFGRKIGITDASCSLLESGRNKPSNPTIRAICRKFHVNEEWLRTGAGEREAFTSDADKLLVEELLAGDNSPFYQLVRKALRVYMDLDADSKKVINSVLERIVQNENRE